MKRVSALSSRAPAAHEGREVVAVGDVEFDEDPVEVALDGADGHHEALVLTAGEN